MSEHKIQSTDAADSIKPGNNSAVTSGKTTPMPSSSSTSLADEEETFDNFDSSPKVPRSKRLVVDLDPVPKFLKNLVEGWSPQGMIISFKLETDPSLLVHKARYSLDRYQHHLVIGNLLYLTPFPWVLIFLSLLSKPCFVLLTLNHLVLHASGKL
jgi:phosphopantothenate---cysteine ligase (ATP)